MILRLFQGLWSRLSLLSRLLILVVLAFALTTVFTLVLIVQQAARDVQSEVDNKLAQELNNLGMVLSPALASRNAQYVVKALDEYRRSAWVVSVGFRDVTDAVDFQQDTPAPLTAPLWFARWCGTQPVTATRPLMVEGEYYGIISLRLSPHPTINTTWRYTQRQLLFYALTFLLVLTGIFIVLRNGLRPLGMLAAGTRSLGQGHLAVRLTPAGSSELRTSIEGFNRMASSIERMVQELQDSEAAMARSKENLRVTLQSIGDGVITTDARGRVTMMNPVAEVLTEWSQHDALGRSVEEVFHIVNEATGGIVESPVAHVLREGRIVGLANHTLLIGRDGAVRPIADSGAPIRLTDDGELIGVVLVFRDQSEEHRRVKALTESQQLYASLVDATPVGIFQVDLAGKPTYSNTQLTELLGYDPVHTGVTLGSSERLTDADKQQQQQAFMLCINERRLVVTVHRLMVGGQVRWVNTRLMPMLDADNRVTGCVGTMEDITAEREHARKIEHLSRLYATLSEINSAIVHSKDTHTLYPEVCRVAHDVGGFIGAWVIVADRDKQRVTLEGVVAKDPDLVRRDVARMRLDAADAQNSLSLQVLLQGERQISNAYLNEDQHRAFHDNVRQLGGRALLGTPIKQDGRTVAVLVLLAEEENYFSDDLITLVDEIAEDISFALDNFERERQRQLAEARLQDNEERLRLALMVSHQGTYEIDFVSQSAHIDAVYAKLLGLPEQAVTMPVDSYVAALASVHDAWLASHTWPPKEPTFGMDGEYVSPTGVHRWLSWTGAVVAWSANGAAARLIGTVTDITERHATEDHLRMTALLFDNSRDAIIITDRQGDIVTVNRAFTDVNGYSAPEVTGRNPRLLASGRHDAAFFREMWQQVMAAGFWQGELWNRRKNGEIYPSLTTVSVVRRPDGVPTHFLSMSADITRQKEFEARISRLAYRDSLTDLPNRALLRDRVERHLVMCLREKTPLAVLFVDLDRFKTINDSLGHSVGDGLLIEFGQRMVQTVRDTDTVGRLGGDEFLIVLPGADATAAARVANKLLQELSRPCVINGHSLVVTPSIGISLCPKDGQTFDSLLKAADAAMYQAKEMGRNNFSFASEQGNQAAMRRLVLEHAMRKGMEHGEFQLHYQPKFDIQGSRLVGLEALLRWRSAELGPVAPAEFIPMAESTGLIDALGTWVIREACRQARAWQDEGLSPVRISVNVSVRQFNQRNITATVEQALHDTGLTGDVLEIEITESLLAGDSAYVLDVMHEFKYRGIQIAVDDFGTGYSSLSYLKRFPIDRLKIDKSFIDTIAQDPDYRAIAGAVVVLGHSLGMQVIAEGVESSEQLQILQDLGCDEVQGYLLARPLPADEVAGLLARKVPV